ncbi:mechanosensitive ion channel [Cardiobacteriaceae bacterium TAE3-ERU3]|nr:mechanosensitive ion channel [Cardiobacteriaceae bacterium TAE3-ERU3]
MRKTLLLLAALLFTSLCLTLSGHAQQAQYAAPIVDTSAQIDTLRSSIKQREETLKKEREQLAALHEEIKAGIDIGQVVSQQALSQQRSQLEEAQVHGDNLRLRLQEITKDIEANRQSREELDTLLQKQSNPLASGEGSTENDIANTRRDIQRNETYAALLVTQLTQINQAIELNAAWKEALGQRYRAYNEHYLEQNSTEDGQRPAKLNNTEQQAALTAERNRLTARLESGNMNTKARLETNIAIAIINKQILFNRLLREIDGIDSRLQEMQFVDYSTVSLERIERVQQEIIDTRARLSSADAQIEQNYSVITEQYGMLTNRQEAIPEKISNRYTAMENQYRDLKEEIELTVSNLDLLANKVDSQYTELSANYLKQRFAFGGNIDGVLDIAANIGEAYGLFAGQYVVSLSTLSNALQDMESLHWAMLIITMLIVLAATILLTIWMNRIVRRYRQDSRLGFTKRLLLFLFGMLKYNLPYIGFFCLSLLLVSITSLPSPSYGLLLLPSIALLMVSIPYFAMRILIDSRLLETTDNLRIINIVGILSGIGSLLFVQVMLAQWILNDSNTIDAFRWVFGAYIAAISIPMWRSVIKMVRFLNEYYADYYAYRILRVVIFIIPIGTTFFGIASLFGYLNFAWINAEFLLYFLLISVIWIGLLAAFKDASLWAKRYALLNTNNGVFWAQDVINPLHTLLRYTSLILLIELLLYIYGWNSNTPLISDLLTLLNDPLLSSSKNTQFTLMNFIIMGVFIYFSFRIGIWIKSFAYRLVFGKIADLGIRNSLAVFGQYAVVTLGLLIALRVIGIDLTAFTVFAGALGVGIGFGLQTIANNFISGIILLIERPLRNGDIISVGGYDGTVERIGMRSLTMTTFNNESVILPNSDFVTSAFKNWSHTDQIVRVILYFDVNYRHDPDQVEAALTAELTAMVAAGELSEIPPDIINRAFAYNCSERGITYRIQYYFHLLDHDFFGTRHQVIRRMWDACHKNGFEIAYPKQDLFFPDHPDQLAHSVRSLPDFRGHDGGHPG